MTAKLVFRSLEERDLAYIINCWMHVARYDGNHHSTMEAEAYKTDYKHRVVIPTLAESYVRIACTEDEPFDILGFLVYRFDIKGNLVIHFANVFKEGRGNGLGRKLVKDVYPDLERPIIFTTYHRKLPFLLKRHPGYEFNPYVTLAPKSEAA